MPGAVLATTLSYFVLIKWLEITRKLITSLTPETGGHIWSEFVLVQRRTRPRPEVGRLQIMKTIYVKSISLHRRLLGDPKISPYTEYNNISCWISRKPANEIGFFRQKNVKQS